MKDPAFLFYPEKFLTGVMTMTYEDRGKYITLLSLMHQQGRLKEETIRFLVGSVSVTLKSKFQIDKNGFWYNEKLEEEMEKRSAFLESRRINGKKGGRPKKPIGYPNGNPNGYPKNNLPIDRDKDVFNKEYNYFILNKNTQFKESVYRNKILAKRIPISYEKYEKMLLEFCQAEQDNGQKPESEPDYRRHFQNWLVIQSEKKESWDQGAKPKLPPEKGYER